MKLRSSMRNLGARMDGWLERFYRSALPYRLSLADKICGLSLCGFFLLLYYYTCSHYPNAAGDSPELLACSYSLGIAHPPGYPLYTMLGYLVTHIPVGSVAFRLNFMSSVFHMLTLFFIFASLIKLTRNRVSAAIATSALGFSALFWFYSLVAEVFSLNDLFAALLIFLSILTRDKWLEGNRDASLRLFALLSFFCGLSLTNHHTIILVFPVVLLFSLGPFLKTMRSAKWFGVSALAFLIGLLPYVYLPWRAAQKPLLHYQDPSTLGGFFDYITRQYYGTSRLWSGPQAEHRLDLVVRFLGSVWSEIHLAGAALFLVGVVHSARKKRADFFPLLTGLITTGVIFPAMANVNVKNVFDLSTVERFFLLELMVAVLFLGIGVGVVIGWVKRFARLLPVRPEVIRMLVWVVALLLAIPFLLPASSTAEKVGLRDDVILETFFNNLLNSAEDNSIVFVIGDVTIEMSMYHQALAASDRDIIFVVYTFLFNESYLETLSLKYPQLKLPSWQDIPPEASVNLFTALSWFVGSLRKNNPQYSAFYINAPREELQEDFLLLPCGTLFEILDKNTEVNLEYYYRSQLEYWRTMDLQGLEEKFYPENNRGRVLAVDTSLYPRDCGNFFFERGEYQKATTFYKLALNVVFSPYYCIRLAKAYQRLGMPEKGLYYLGGALLAESPQNPTYWEDYVLFEELLEERSER